MKVLGSIGIAGSIYAFLWSSELSLVFLFIALIATIVEFIRDPRIPFSWWWGLIFLGMWVAAGLWTDFTITGSFDKFIRIISLSTLYILIPPMIFKTEDDLKVLTKALLIGGLCVGAISLPDFLHPTGWRLSPLGANPIQVSRLISIAVIILLHLSKKSKIFLLPVPLFIVMMLSTGSKGPLIALIVAIFFLYGLKFKSVVMASVTGWFALKLGAMFLPSHTWERVSLLWNGIDEPVRTLMYKTCLRLIPEDFMGYGVGYFASTEIGLYPHNYVLETFLEAGWIPGIYLIFLLCLGAILLHRLKKHNSIYGLALSLYMLEIVLCLFTGDITGLKLFYIFLTVGAMHYGKVYATDRRMYFLRMNSGRIGTVK